jgi:hypothetical protein
MECKRWSHWGDLVSLPKGELSQEESLLKQETVNIWKSGKVELLQFNRLEGITNLLDGTYGECFTEYRQYRFVGNNGKV